MSYNKPVTELVKQRFSCRSYTEKPIEGEKRQLLEDFLSRPQIGPFGTQARFSLIAATEEDRKALKGLGTYGFIKGATGFIVGAMGNGAKSLEDFGYLMERIILFATDVGLGTCWLGGTFNKSGFAKKISVGNRESIPAITAIGHMSDKQHAVGRMIRQGAKADKRLPWKTMFFADAFGNPLTPETAGPHATPLEMVRLGPSASNKQPWRIVRKDNAWHFYLQRTKGYRGKWVTKLLKVADIQRLDMGIAMCHFELAADELGLKGRWELGEPEIEKPEELTEYTVSWIGQEG
jgi:nitroreductase